MSWIFLRGLTREARHWGEFSPRFAEKLGNEDIITLDLPGNGEFAALDSPLTVRGMTEFVRQQLHIKNIQRPVKLLAMSLGGMIATDWAQNWPQEVSQLVLINTSMRPFSRLPQRLRPGNWPTLAGLVLHWKDAGHVEKTIHRLTCQRLDNLTADIRRWTEIRQSAPVSALNAQRQLWAAARFACAPQPPACPVLLLSSAGDQLVNPACSSHVAQAWPDAKQAQHPWAGHDLPHDDANWVAGQVGNWLK